MYSFRRTVLYLKTNEVRACLKRCRNSCNVVILLTVARKINIPVEAFNLGL